VFQGFVEKMSQSWSYTYFGRSFDIALGNLCGAKIFAVSIMMCTGLCLCLWFTF